MSGSPPAMPDEALVFCDSNKDGLTLDKFLRHNKKVTKCSECGYWSRFTGCKLGYKTSAEMSPCRQAISVKNGLKRS